MENQSSKISAAAGSRLTNYTIGKRTAPTRTTTAHRPDSINDTLEMTDSDSTGRFFDNRSENEPPSTDRNDGPDDSLGSGDVLDITG